MASQKQLHWIYSCLQMGKLMLLQ